MRFKIDTNKLAKLATALVAVWSGYISLNHEEQNMLGFDSLTDQILIIICFNMVILYSMIYLICMELYIQFSN